MRGKVNMGLSLKRDLKGMKEHTHTIWEKKVLGQKPKVEACPTLVCLRSDSDVLCGGKSVKNGYDKSHASFQEGWEARAHTDPVKLLFTECSGHGTLWSLEKREYRGTGKESQAEPRNIRPFHL